MVGLYKSQLYRFTERATIMSKIYGYVRVSTTVQAEDGVSLEVQAKQIRAYAVMKDLAEPDVIVEAGVSGSIPFANRPAGGALLNALQAGDVLICAKLDRLFRSALDALQMTEILAARGVHVHLIDLGGDIAGNGLSKLFLTVAAAFAEAERDRIIERVRDTKRSERAEGRFLGGSTPFGFTVGEDGALIEDPAQQAAIERMHVLRAAGLSLRSIAETVTKETGISVSHVTVDKALKARRAM